jgi:hypothetical protein
MGTHSTEDGPHPPASFQSYLAAIPEVLSGRSLFRTGECYFGLAPPTAQSGDVVVVLLGCHSPMVLRPSEDGRYQVIGEAYGDEFANGEALLGQLPEKIDLIWRLISGGSVGSFVDRETGDFLEEDPRLGPLPPGWQCDLGDARDLFWNDELGIMRDTADPRLTPEALRKRGVPLRTFELI